MGARKRERLLIFLVGAFALAPLADARNHDAPIDPNTEIALSNEFLSVDQDAQKYDRTFAVLSQVLSKRLVRIAMETVVTCFAEFGV